MKGSTVVGKIPAGIPDAGNHGCRLAGGCVHFDPVSLLLVIFWAGVFCFTLLGTLSTIPNARRLLSDERDRTNAERNAFTRFVRKISSLNASQPAAMGTNLGTGTNPGPGSNLGLRPNPGSSPSPGAGLRSFAESSDSSGARMPEVREAYRRTVMRVDHYDEEYDEPLQTNMAAEFGDQLAAAVASDDPLTPQVKAALVDRSTDAADEREAFLTTLARESEEISDATSVLSPIDEECTNLAAEPFDRYSFDELLATWRRVRNLQSDCETYMNERQRSIHDGFTLGTRGGDSSTFHAYLYEPLDVTYPVLSDGSLLIERLQRVEHQVIELMTHRI